MSTYASVGDSVRRFVEEQALTHRVTCAKRHQSYWSSVDVFFDGDGASVDDDRNFARRTFLEDDLVVRVRNFRNELRELVNRCVGEPGEEARFAQVFTDL